MQNRRALRLGDLERAVLDRLWSGGPDDVRGVHAAVGRPRGITPNTVQSALERLSRKGFVTRSRHGRAYVYASALSRSQWLARSIGELVQDLPGFEREGLVAAFVDVAERAGEAELAALERRVRRRRAERSRS